MQAHIAEVKRAERAGQTPEQAAPARSKAGDHWEAKDDRTRERPGTVSEKLEEAARRRQQDRGATHRRSWGIEKSLAGLPGFAHNLQVYF